MVQHGETRIYVLKVELKMDARSVAWMFLAESKINHILASLGPPDGKCVVYTKNLPRNIIV